jgi:type IV secretion system protein VirD4
VEGHRVTTSTPTRHEGSGLAFGGLGQFGWVVVVAPAAALGVACLAVWAAGGVAGLLGGQGWPEGRLTQMPHILAHLAGRDRADPRRAWPNPRQLPGPIPLYSTIAAVSLALVGIIIVGALALHRRYRPAHPTATRTRSGRREQLSNSWNKPVAMHDLQVAGPEAGRITLGYSYGRLVAASPEHSVIVAGATRSGKTTGFAVPLILQWAGPIVVCSTKTDLVNLTLTRRQQVGPVWVFDPTGVADPDGTAGVTRHNWSPLHYSDTFSGALVMADAWTDASPAVHDDGPSAYWKPHANALAAACLYAARKGGQSMGAVLTWFKRSNMAEGAGGQFADAVHILSRLQHTDSDARTALDSLGYVLAMEYRQRDSAVGTCRAVFEVYDDPRVAAASLGATTIDPATLLDGAARSLYLVANRQEQKRLAPLFTALLTFIDRELSARAARIRAATSQPLRDETERLLFVLDEVAKLAPLRNLPDIASEIGGEGGALLTLVQDFSQLEEQYRVAWRSLVNNHPVAVALAGIRDKTTQEWFADNAGRERVVDHSRSWSRDGNRNSQSEQLRRELVIDSAGVRQLLDMTGLAIYLNRKPFKLALRPWWEDQHLRDLVHPAADADHAEYEARSVHHASSDARLASSDEQDAATAGPVVVAEHPRQVRPSVSGERCRCGHLGGQHSGKANRGRCVDCDCRRFGKKQLAGASVDRMPEPLDSFEPATPTSAELQFALHSGEALRTGSGHHGPVHYQGRFYRLADGAVDEITAGPQVSALRAALLRARLAAAAEAAENGEVERIGDDPAMPFLHAGTFYVPTEDGLQPVTDTEQIQACQRGLDRIRASRATEEPQ